MSETLLFTPPAIIQPADVVEAELAALDSKVDGAEHDGLRFRWEFGKTLAARVASLPYGTRTEYVDGLAERLGKSGRELRYRMQFAQVFPTDDDFCNALQNFSSWFAIVNEGLPSGDMTVHHSSESAEWYTPAHVIEAVIETMGAIDLDPCSNLGEPTVPAGAHFTVTDDGLSLDWWGRVYMNPPYGRVISRWTEKLRESHESGDVSEAVALVPARTDTDWMVALRSYPRCFIKGRLTFSGHKNAAPFPSCAVYLGAQPEKFARVFAKLGDTYQLLGA